MYILHNYAISNSHRRGVRMEAPTTTLIDIATHPNFINWFVDYLDFLSIGMLRNALRKNRRGSKSPIYSLSFRKHVDMRLSILSINPPSFWGNMTKSRAVIHGSFLLSCLLDPLSGNTLRIFTKESDIDIMVPRPEERNPFCKSCVRKLYVLAFPTRNQNVTVDIMIKELGINISTPKTRYDSLDRLIVDGVINDTIASMVRSHFCDPYCTNISMYLCHNTTLNYIAEDYKYEFGTNAKWNATTVKIDETRVNVYFDSGLSHFIENHVDFDIGKVLYDGKKLKILHLYQLLKRECRFPDIEVIKHNISKNKRYKLSQSLDIATKKRVNKLYDRVRQYEKKGITVLMTDEQLKYTLYIRNSQAFIHAKP